MPAGSAGFEATEGGFARVATPTVWGCGVYGGRLDVALDGQGGTAVFESHVCNACDQTIGVRFGRDADGPPEPLEALPEWVARGLLEDASGRRFLSGCVVSAVRTGWGDDLQSPSRLRFELPPGSSEVTAHTTASRGLAPAVCDACPALLDTEGPLVHRFVWPALQLDPEAPPTGDDAACETFGVSLGRPVYGDPDALWVEEGGAASLPQEMLDALRDR